MKILKVSLHLNVNVKTVVEFRSYTFMVNYNNTEVLFELVHVFNYYN